MLCFWHLAFLFIWFWCEVFTYYLLTKRVSKNPFAILVILSPKRKNVLNAHISSRKIKKIISFSILILLVPIYHTRRAFNANIIPIIKRILKNLLCLDMEG